MFWRSPGARGSHGQGTLAGSTPSTRCTASTVSTTLTRMGSRTVWPPGRAGVRGSIVQNSSLVEIPDLMIDTLKKVIIA